MRKLLLIFLSFLSLDGLTADDTLTRKFVPLETFGITKGSSYKKDSISDADGEYVAWRCLGLTTAIANVSLEPKTEKDKLIIQGFKAFKLLATEHAYLNFNFNNKLTQDDYKSSNPFEVKAKEVLGPINDRYLNIFLLNFDKVGSYFDSEFINGDIDACGSSFIMLDSLKKE